MTAHDIARELRDLIAAGTLGTERSQQTQIGPSQLGTTCTRCLVHGLAETPRTTVDASLYSWIGTAVHSEMECLLVRDELRRAGHLGAAHTEPRWHTERRVVVGEITHPTRPGQRMILSGTADLYVDGVVVDFKTAGRDKARTIGDGRPPAIYVHQAQLYGLGYELAGYPVREVMILAIPRTGRQRLTPADITHCAMPYDRADALATLARADSWARVIAAYGVQAALDLAGPHTGEEYSCGDYGDAPPPQRAKEKAPLTLLPAETPRK